MLGSFIFWWVFCSVLAGFNYRQKECNHVQKYNDEDDVRWKYIDW